MRRLLGLAVALGGAVLLAWVSRAPMRAHATDDGVLRVAWSARPERVERCVTRSDEELKDVPVHMRQRTVCEGRSARYRLLVRQDGAALADEVVTGSGARHDRPIYLLRDFPVRPGAHDIEVSFSLLDSTGTSAEASEAAGLLADRERREVQERERRRREAVPPRLELAVRQDVAAGAVLLITYDAERRELVARSAAGSP